MVWGHGEGQGREQEGLFEVIVIMQVSGEDSLAQVRPWGRSGGPVPAVVLQMESTGFADGSVISVG